jgi:hypothetical protein
MCFHKLRRRFGTASGWLHRLVRCGCGAAPYSLIVRQIQCRFWLSLLKNVKHATERDHKVVWICGRVAMPRLRFVRVPPPRCGLLIEYFAAGGIVNNDANRRRLAVTLYPPAIPSRANVRIRVDKLR